MPAFSSAGRVAARLLRPRRGSAAGGASGAWKKAAARAGRHFWGHVGQVARRLGLQVSAVLYLIFAVSFAAEGYRGWARDHQALHRHMAGGAGLTTLGSHTELMLGLALVFAYFGVSSLARARQAPSQALKKGS
ncbi:MAG TPA: hypothetical protein VNE83_01755 [Terriglobales bacterium]|nr:hypothetical protein [Terriglobales bacterium]